MHVDAARRANRQPINTAPGAAPAGVAPLAWVVLAVGLGLLVCAAANALSRAAEGPPLALFWAGLVLIAAPIFLRLTSTRAGFRERLLLVALLGLALYLVKVMRDAPLFTFSDEQVHAFNAERIDETGKLFGDNPILEVTPYYPGLEGAATALMKLTGLSIYPAGVILIGAARVLMLVALFLLFDRVSGSARAAGLGVGIYAGNFNFLYWGAQFSYESLSLPLLLMLMMALAEREAAPREALRAWAVPVLLAMAAIVVTHHLSSYATAALLTALALSYWYVRRSWRAPNPWPFAVAATAMAVFWLFVVASATVGYLTPVLSNAFQAIANTIAGSDPPRSLFEGEGPTVEPTPLAGKALALVSLAALLSCLPFGLLQIRRHHARKPFALLFGLAAVAFFASLSLRLAPPAWETGNRASEFLFIGLAFTIACAFVAALRRYRERPWARLAVAGAVSLFLVGGAISGWPWDSQLARPMRIEAGGRTLPSPSLSAAEWAARRIDGGRFAATNADAGLLLVPGGKVAKAGSSPAIEDILDAEYLDRWELPLLRRHRLRYVVADRRYSSADTLRGHFFETQPPSSATYKDRSTTVKFNHLPRASRIYTNGPVTIFDLEGRR